MSKAIKDSKDLPKSWKWKTIGEISETTSGGTPSRHIKSYWNGNIPWLKSGELTDGVVYQATEFITEIGLKNSSAKIFSKGTLLIALYGATAGKLGILDFETTTNQAVCGINSKNNSFVTKFVFYFLLDIREQIIQDSFGGAQPNISQAYIRNLEIPLPPLAEQQRIVKKLDTLFESIDKAIALSNENLQHANNLLPAALNEVFENNEKQYGLIPLNDLCTKITDGAHLTPKYTKEGVPFLSVKDITGNTINFSNTRFISIEEHNALYKRCNPEYDDILYTKVGTTGVAKVVDTEREFSLFVSIALLKPKKKIVDSKFLEHMLNSPDAYAQAQSRTRGVANRNLVLNDIKQIELPIPKEIKTQQKIVNHLNAISAQQQQLQQHYTQQLQQLKALKASLLSAAFSGAL